MESQPSEEEVINTWILEFIVEKVHAVPGDFYGIKSKRFWTMLMLHTGQFILRYDEAKLPLLMDILQHLIEVIEDADLRAKILKCILTAKLKMVLNELDDADKSDTFNLKNYTLLNNCFELEESFMEKLTKIESEEIQESIADMKTLIISNFSTVVEIYKKWEAKETCIKEFSDMAKSVKMKLGKGFLMKVADKFGKEMAVVSKERLEKLSKSHQSLRRGKRKPVKNRFTFGKSARHNLRRNAEEKKSRISAITTVNEPSNLISPSPLFDGNEKSYENLQINPNSMVDKEIFAAKAPRREISDIEISFGKEKISHLKNLKQSTIFVPPAALPREEANEDNHDEANNCEKISKISQPRDEKNTLSNFQRASIMTRHLLPMEKETRHITADETQQASHASFMLVTDDRTNFHSQNTDMYEKEDCIIYSTPNKISNRHRLNIARKRKYIWSENASISDNTRIILNNNHDTSNVSHCLDHLDLRLNDSVTIPDEIDDVDVNTNSVMTSLDCPNGTQERQLENGVDFQENLYQQDKAKSMSNVKIHWERLSSSSISSEDGMAMEQSFERIGPATDEFLGNHYRSPLLFASTPQRTKYGNRSNDTGSETYVDTETSSFSRFQTEVDSGSNLTDSQTRSCGKVAQTLLSAIERVKTGKDNSIISISSDDTQNLDLQSSNEEASPDESVKELGISRKSESQNCSKSIELLLSMSSKLEKLDDMINDMKTINYMAERGKMDSVNFERCTVEAWNISRGKRKFFTRKKSIKSHGSESSETNTTDALLHEMN